MHKEIILKYKHITPLYKKTTGKWGIKGSTFLDSKTEEEAYEKYYNYLKKNNLI